jgi:2-succinyl-5-enolpyruvyl-6-hydroxy-3-cyclohexene-1-carboxylate synthase
LYKGVLLNMINYSIEKNVQIIISLLKAHKIRRVIASPGSTNVCLVASLQSDDYFKIYSSIDERSAAYLACGMASETGKPVVLTCTEATASRNYMSGLTEAFYRKLPILAITATNDLTEIGSNRPQMIDRSVVPNDLVKKSLRIPTIHSKKERKGYTVLLNDAILELTRRGGGPVHIEYETEYSRDYSTTKLPCVQVIKRITSADKFPPLTQGNIAIYVGAHKRWSEELTLSVDKFCKVNNAVVLNDHISNYHGNYGVYSTIITSQKQKKYPCCDIDLLIYIGDISYAYKKNLNVKNYWRVNPDGEVRSIFENLSYVFEMDELDFFKRYSLGKNDTESNTLYLKQWVDTYNCLFDKIPELPFSNLWVAGQTTPLLPKDSILFLGIENTLRSWNFYDKDPSIDGFCNTGGFGIDGGISSLIGASLVNKNKLYFGITGDLAFFYDMNVLGNKHIGKNIRLMVINNGIGQQFKNTGHPASVLGDSADVYVAAAGHFGNKSPLLLKHYAEDLGFKYISASTKEEFSTYIDKFVSPEVGENSVLFEVFTDTIDETKALDIISNLEVSASSTAKRAAKKLLGDSGIKIVRKILN